MEPEIKAIFFVLAFALALWGYFKEYRVTALSFAAFVVPFMWDAIDAAGAEG